MAEARLAQAQHSGAWLAHARVGAAQQGRDWLKGGPRLFLVLGLFQDEPLMQHHLQGDFSRVGSAGRLEADWAR